MTAADRLRVLATSISSLERIEYQGGLKPWQKEFLKQARKLRVKLQQKALI